MFETRQKEKEKDSELHNLLLQWSGEVQNLTSEVVHNNGNVSGASTTCETVKVLRLNMPAYFNDVILRQYMPQ